MQAIWIELPTTDLPRAKAFYEAVFGHAPTDVIEGETRAITVIPGSPTVSLNHTRVSWRMRTALWRISRSRTWTPRSPRPSGTAAG